MFFTHGLDHLDGADVIELASGVAIVLEVERREVVEAGGIRHFHCMILHPQFPQPGTAGQSDLRCFAINLGKCQHQIAIQIT